MALTSAIERAERGDHRIVNAPVAANAVMYQGALLAFNATGFITNAADTANFKFAGIAMEDVDNTGGADGALNIELIYVTTVFIPLATATQASVGLEAWATGSDTIVTVAPVNINSMGLVTEYDSGAVGKQSIKGVWVETSIRR
jgi:hypothetical protein